MASETQKALSFMFRPCLPLPSLKRGEEMTKDPSAVGQGRIEASSGQRDVANEFG